MTTYEHRPHLNQQLTAEQATLAAAADPRGTKALYQAMYSITVEHQKRGLFPNDLREPQRDLFNHTLAQYRIADDATVVEVGCGLGHLHVCHKNWRGFEYSGAAVQLAKERYGQGLNITEADATRRPTRRRLRRDRRPRCPGVLRLARLEDAVPSDLLEALQLPRRGHHGPEAGPHSG